MENVNDYYFDGLYKEIWRAVIPDDLTNKEADFIIQQFSLQPGSQVLDLMCGYGRHAVALAQKGIQVTAVDNLPSYIKEIEEKAVHKDLPITPICASALAYRPEEKFDLAICMGNSLNFFPAKETEQILHNIVQALKPGGVLFINSWSLAETVIPSFIANAWSEVNGVKLLTDSKYLFRPSRIESNTIMITPDGKEEHKKAVDYIFTVGEMESMLNNAGFEMEEIYSVPGRKKFALGDKRAYIIARKK